MEEIWKGVVGYEGAYQVNNFGEVISLNYNHGTSKKAIKAFDNNGYIRVTLFSNGKRKNMLVHRLVAEAFLENPERRETVNHIDGNKKNNCVDNLEWATRKENTNHAILHGLRPAYCKHRSFKGELSPRAKKVYQYSLNGQLLNVWPVASKVADELGYLPQSILRCCRGERKTYKHYVWSFEEL